MTDMARPQLSDFDRAALVRRGIWLSYATIGYNSLEAIGSLIAGLLAGSVALVGFGVDSVIEVMASIAAQWRLRSDLDPVRREAAQESGRPAVQVWVTTGDQSKLLSRQADVSFSYDVPSPIPTIDVDEGRSYQQMIGFGTLPAASVVTFNLN